MSISKSQRLEVADRDNWICSICDLPIRKNTTDTKDPGYLHIDHIEAKAHGGSDEIENLRATHGFCNMSRGAGNEWKSKEDAAKIYKLRVIYPHIDRTEVIGRKRIENNYFINIKDIGLLEFVDIDYGNGPEPYVVIRYDKKNRRFLKARNSFGMWVPETRANTL